MKEAAARQMLIDEFDVSRETLVKIEAFVEFLRAVNETQNLVSRSSLAEVWNRHILDSAQLLMRAPVNCPWLDLGTGAGFPGLIIALLHDRPVTLIEERRLRADFLIRACDRLGISRRAQVICAKVERVETAAYGVISARALAPLDKLLALGERFAAPETRWVLPKGRNAKLELEAVKSSWQGEFRLEPSLTDRQAHIIVAEGVRRR